MATSAIGGRGDAGPMMETDITTMAMFSTGLPSSEAPTTWLERGDRGLTWEHCTEWFETMPGSLFQLACLLFFLAFMGGGKNAVAATYTHVMCACAFFILSIFAGVDACAPDIVVWGLILVVVNIAQIIYISHKTKVMARVFDGDRQMMYYKHFAPFNVSRELFVELVTCKGCELLKLERGQKYSAEGKTPIEKLSVLVSGKLTVSCGGAFLHYISGNDFLDSPEWESLKSTSKSTYKVTITADTECRFISWRRKPLLSFLGKKKRLEKLFGFMIGRDIVKKLYALNTRQFTAEGFHYDIRLPCIMSLREDVCERERKRKEAISQPGTPAGRRPKKLGKKANEHYAKLFTRRMSERIMMMKDRTGPLSKTSRSQS